MARGRVIGLNGTMPWHLPADLAHFKRITSGHPVLMGRKTFDSIGRALPGRFNVVISRGRPRLPAGVTLAASLDQALSLCPPVERVMVIGGAEIYAQAIDRAALLELTLIDADLAGDTRFPAVSLGSWQLQQMSVRPADAANAWTLTFCRFRRVDRP